MLSCSRVFFTIFCTNVWKWVHDSKETVNILGLFVLTVSYLFISTLSFLLFLYIVPWRNKGHYLHASYTYCFILCSILLTPRWNIRLFYTTFVFTIKKVRFWTCPTHPSPPFIATSLRMTLWIWFEKNGNLLMVISGFSELKFPTLILFLLGWLALF